MTEDENFTGFAIYTFSDLTQMGSAAWEVTDAFAARPGRSGFSRYMAFTLDGRKSRDRAYNKKTAAELQCWLENGEIGSVSAGDQPATASSAAGFELSLELDATTEGRGRPNIMFVSLSRESLAKLGGTEHLLGLAKLAAQKLNCCYGYIWTAADYWFARAGARGVGLQIGQTRMSDWETERTSAWSAGRKRCDRLVRDVYWASFLGPGHLEIIRPLDELQQSGLIASFEALGDGRYLVLVTRELDEFLTPSGQARAEKLREALSPIIARRSPPPKNLLVPPSYLTGEAGEENLGRIRRMADHAISDLKEDLNINLDWTEESLAILDRALTPEYLRHIAELDRQKEFTPEDWRSLHMVLVGAIGSYLGEMVLKHIGGKWLPRDPYFYSTISFGPREYDPYAMAEKRLADCEGELLLPHFRWIRERETK